MPLTWGLAISTYNRADVLPRCVRLALQQTRPPVEVVICDSTPDPGWDQSKQAVEQCLHEFGPNVRLRYLRSPAAQQTIQRNVAIDAASADILFMIDDDSLMYTQCAEHTMSLYEAPEGDRIVGIAPGEASHAPDEPQPSKRNTLVCQAGRSSLTQRLLSLYYYGWHPRPRKPLPSFQVQQVPLPHHVVREMVGAFITCRREVVKKVRFDEHLVTGHFEDGEASRRLCEHGLLLHLDLPLIYHATAVRPTGQGRRSMLARWGWVMNLAYLQRKHYGHHWQIRAHSFFNWIRFVGHDFALGLFRRDFTKLKGCLLALPSLCRLQAASPDTYADTLVTLSHQMRSRQERHE